MVTRRPRDLSRLPKLEAVSLLPSEDATPPVTKTCLVGADEAKETSRCQTEKEKGMSAMRFQRINGFPFSDNQPCGRDRTSDWKGKSVLVRVGCGGRRIY